MKREFNGYQGQKKASTREFIFGCCFILFYFIIGDNITEIVITIIFSITFLVHSVFSLYRARESTLILDNDSIKLITPLMNVRTSWQNISLVGMKDLPPQQYAISSPDMDLETTSLGSIFMPSQEYAIYSPDMKVETTRLGNIFMPTSVEDDILEKGLPISIFLGDDLDEILALFSTYPGFKNKR